MDNFSEILKYVEAMWLKFQVIFGSTMGWITAALVTAFNFFLPEIYAFGVVLTAIILDAIFGLTVALGVRKDFALSKLGRVTLFKISAYFATLIIAYMVEKMLHDEGGFISVKVVAGWAAACEFWSLSASVLIVWPDAFFFKIMRKQLKGEIESKLNKDIADVLPEK